MSTWRLPGAACLVFLAGATACGPLWGAAQPLRIACVYDSGRHAAANRDGENHWDIYLREIGDQLGARMEEVPPAALGNPEQLAQYATVLVGGLAADDLPAETLTHLERWIRGGGTLIALATQGLDALCGNRSAGLMRQPGDPFTCSATFALQPHRLTQDIHSILQPAQRLLIFSDVRQMTCDSSCALATLYDLDGRDTGYAAITGRQLDKGHVFYFAFGVPQTMWVLHQGRPVDQDYDGDGMLRRSDAVVIRPHSVQVLYADEILFLLGNMIGVQPHPLVHQLPPTGAGAIPDALFHWGGDDEASAAGIQLVASDFMRQQGLPYHINAMWRPDGTFGLSVADADKIRANGHEIAPHFDFMTGYASGAGFTREQVLAQAEAFREHFGTGWTCSVNHVTRWTGWAEPAKWMREAGGKADNSFVHAGSPPANPVNMFGFSFGTAFPFWFYDDWQGGNQKIDFLEEPFGAYECGYRDQTQTDFETLHAALDLAARHHLTMNMFHHPIYIAEYPACQQAIAEGLRYLQERQIRALHLGNDAVCHWWQARSESQLREVVLANDRLTFQTQCGYAEGMIVKVPLGTRTAVAAAIEGSPGVVRFEQETLFGQNWALVVVPCGQQVVTLSLE